MNLINALDINIARADDGHTVRQAVIAGGEPDACGHRFLVDVSRQRNGTYLVQTNFNEIFESRHTFAEAMAYAMTIATQIDQDGHGPEHEED